MNLLFSYKTAVLRAIGAGALVAALAAPSAQACTHSEGSPASHSESSPASSSSRDGSYYIPFANEGYGGFARASWQASGCGNIVTTPPSEETEGSSSEELT